LAGFTHACTPKWRFGTQAWPLLDPLFHYKAKNISVKELFLAQLGLYFNKWMDIGAFRKFHSIDRIKGAGAGLAA